MRWRHESCSNSRNNNENNFFVVSLYWSFQTNKKNGFKSECTIKFFLKQIHKSQTYFQAYWFEFKIIHLTHSAFAIWRKSRKRVRKKFKIKMHIFNWLIYLKSIFVSINLKLKSFTCLCLIKNLSWIFSRNNKQTLHYHFFGCCAPF